MHVPKKPTLSLVIFLLLATMAFNLPVASGVVAPVEVGGTCGPATHPAVPVGAVPGQAGSYAIVYQFQGDREGTAYVSYFMQTNTANNEFEDFAIVFGGYDLANGGYDKVAGDKDDTSGSCIQLGSMPTSHWTFDVTGGGGGFTSSTSCSSTTYWEGNVHGDIGFGTGTKAGWEFNAGGSYTWGASETCSDGTEYDSGILISGDIVIEGPCIECITSLGLAFNSPPMPRAAVITPTVDYEHCSVDMVPVSAKMADATCAIWQLWQQYDPLDDSTPVIVVYENAPTTDRFFALSVAPYGTDQWYGSGGDAHVGGATFGCMLLQDATPVFGYFDYDARAQSGDGDCYSPGITLASAPNITPYSIDSVKYHVKDHLGYYYHGAFGDDLDCQIDIYETTITMDTSGSAEVCLACVTNNP